MWICLLGSDALHRKNRLLRRIAASSFRGGKFLRRLIHSWNLAQAIQRRHIDFCQAAVVKIVYSRSPLGTLLVVA